MLRSVLSLRRPDEGIWIDALCIDQNNEFEKQHAIASMDLVYKSARLVVILLEDVFINEAEICVVDLLVDDTHWTALTGEFADLVVSLTVKISASRWFSRAWCYQELELSRDTLFLIMGHRGTFHFTTAMLTNLSMLGFRHRENEILQGPRPEAAIDLTFGALLHKTSSKPVMRRGRCKIYKQISQTILKLYATNPTDKISIALNVSGIQLAYLRGPQLTEECDWILAMMALAAGDASVLCGTSQRIRVTDHSMKLKRTWLHRDDEPDFDRFAPKLPLEMYDKEMSYEHVTLDLLLMDLKDSAVSPCSNASSKAEEFIRQCRSMKNQKPFAGTWISSLQPGSSDLQAALYVLQSTIEASLSLGFQWMRDHGAAIDTAYNLSSRRLKEGVFLAEFNRIACETLSISKDQATMINDNPEIAQHLRDLTLLVSQGIRILPNYYSSVERYS